MAGWKKYVFVALICLLVLGLMLYGDLAPSGNSGAGRHAELGTATVQDRINQKAVELSNVRIGEIVTLFQVTGVSPVVNPTMAREKGVATEDYIASYLYYDHAYANEHYFLAPKNVDDWINNQVWRQQERLVNPDDPQREQMRATKAGELGTNVRAIEEFVRRGGAGMVKQGQFLQSLKHNRSDLALLYLISRERARMRYMEFPAQNYLEQARTAMAGNTEALEKRYNEDKAKARSKEGETGESMSAPFKMQFDVFFIEQDAFFAAEAAKINKGDVLKEYNKQREDYEQRGVDNMLVKEKAWAHFADYQPGDKSIAPLVIDPQWRETKDKGFLSPEEVVLDYIKYKQMIPRILIGRSSAVIREFASQYNKSLTAAKPEERAEFAVGFLDRLKVADAVAHEQKFQFVKYLRTDLASFKAYATAPQTQLSAATKTPYPLNTFFDQVLNRGMLPELQKGLSDPLNYTIAIEDGKPLLSSKSGGSLVFQVHAVQNLDPTAAIMPPDSAEAKALLVERLARAEASILAKAAAQNALEEWKKDPSKVPTDPTVLKEFVEPENNAQQPNPEGNERRLFNILQQFSTAANANTADLQMPEPVLAGQVVGPFNQPLTNNLSDADQTLTDCFVIGFIAQYHQVADPMARVTADAGWRGGQSPQMLEFALTGYYGLGVKMIHSAVPDAYSVTVTKPQPPTE